ncbi:MAG: phenylpropionate dioxygenase-like ring-hydroxylating dioxygenase large terminal subunit, partial [Planctomycetota bacterium]
MNVQEHWYPVAFEQDLVPTGLKRIQLLGKGYVLFRGEDGDLACLEDRCPHRMARLSDGR